MSSLAIITLLFATPTAEEPIPMITVIGQKLADWKGVLKSRDGVRACETTRSTGDAEIDAIGCEALEACVLPLAPQIEAIAGGDQSRRDKRRALNALNEREGVADCVGAKREEGVQRLADKRAGE